MRINSVAGYRRIVSGFGGNLIIAFGQKQIINANSSEY